MVLLTDLSSLGSCSLVHFSVQMLSEYRNQLANLSCPLLDIAAVGRQLWARIPKYIYDTSI